MHSQLQPQERLDYLGYHNGEHLIVNRATGETLRHRSKPQPVRKRPGNDDDEDMSVTSFALSLPLVAIAALMIGHLGVWAVTSIAAVRFLMNNPSVMG